MNSEQEIFALKVRIAELEQRVEHLRFSRRVLLNLLEKALRDQKASKAKLLQFNPGKLT